MPSIPGTLPVTTPPGSLSARTNVPFYATHLYRIKQPHFSFALCATPEIWGYPEKHVRQTQIYARLVRFPFLRAGLVVRAAFVLSAIAVSAY